MVKKRAAACSATGVPPPCRCRRCRGWARAIRQAPQMAVVGRAPTRRGRPLRRSAPQQAGPPPRRLRSGRCPSTHAGAPTTYTATACPPCSPCPSTRGSRSASAAAAAPCPSGSTVSCSSSSSRPRPGTAGHPQRVQGSGCRTGWGASRPPAPLRRRGAARGRTRCSRGRSRTRRSRGAGAQQAEEAGRPRRHRVRLLL